MVTKKTAAKGSPADDTTTGADAAAAAAEAPFADIRKALEQLKLPGLDVQALLDGRRKDIEAVVAANKKAYEGMKSLAERQVGLISESVTEWQAAAKELAGLPPAEQAARTAEMGKEALDKALVNMRELAETSLKTQTEAWTIVGDHFRESLKSVFKRG